jgi:hypothetical protein
MLSDVLHVVLRRYLESMSEEQSRGLLTAFVNDNQHFFRYDTDINVRSSPFYTELFATSGKPRDL